MTTMNMSNMSNILERNGLRFRLARVASALFALILCASMMALPARALAATDAATANGAQSGTYVFDERGLFDSSQFDTLESKAQELANKYNMGVYFLTTTYMGGYVDPTSSQRTEYATNYYKEHQLGLNPGSNGYGDGIMFVVAADSRDYVTVAYGQGSYAFSDKGIAKMEDDVTGYLGKDNWYGAAEAYYNDIGSQLAYYASHGSAQKPFSLFDWILRIALVLGIPLIVTFLVIRSWRSQMLTAVEQSEAGNYLDRESVNLTRSNDRFVTTTLVATPRPKRSDSGGGGWGGGGGGGFSSSGGGKF